MTLKSIWLAGMSRNPKIWEPPNTPIVTLPSLTIAKPRHHYIGTLHLSIKKCINDIIHDLDHWDCRTVHEVPYLRNNQTGSCFDRGEKQSLHKMPT